MSTLDDTRAADLFRRPPQRFVDVGHGEVAVRHVGNGPDVVFSHGWPVTGATFRRLLPHLASSVRCHPVDHVGAGQALRPRGIPRRNCSSATPHPRWRHAAYRLSLPGR